MSTMDVVTFRPPQGCRGEHGPAFQGNFRKGELRRNYPTSTKTTASAATPAASSARSMPFQGHLGAMHKIRDDQRCVTCGQCLISLPVRRHRTDELCRRPSIKMLADKIRTKFVVAHPSPAVRVSHRRKNSAASPAISAPTRCSTPSKRSASRSTTCNQHC